MDYTVLKTLSGTPAFSVEQRNYYNTKQQEIKDTLGDFCFLDPEFKKFPMFTRYFDYQMFLKTDLKNQAAHPIHLYMQTLQLFFKQCNEKEHNLKIQLEFNEISEEEYNNSTKELFEKVKVSKLEDVENDLKKLVADIHYLRLKNKL